jgi:hypothetical protein
VSRRRTTRIRRRRDPRAPRPRTLSALGRPPPRCLSGRDSSEAAFCVVASRSSPQRSHRLLGSHMVSRLVQRDHQVVAFDLDKDAVKEAEGNGAEGAEPLPCERQGEYRAQEGPPHGLGGPVVEPVRPAQATSTKGESRASCSMSSVSSAAGSPPRRESRRRLEPGTPSRPRCARRAHRLTTPRCRRVQGTCSPVEAASPGRDVWVGGGCAAYQ